MGRIAGDDPYYTFHLVRVLEGGAERQITEYDFRLPSVTTIIDEVLGIPASAMSWYGYRLGLAAVADLWTDIEAGGDTTAEGIENVLRGEQRDPNHALEGAGSRGHWAHDALEFLCLGKRSWAEDMAAYEAQWSGTKYVTAVIDWFDSYTQGWEEPEDGSPLFPHPNVMSERPVWSLRHGYSGTFDMASQVYGTWEIIDLKTHKPARGYTKPGSGPAYRKDLVQGRAYRMAAEEMGLGPATKQRIVIARANGKYLEDTREVSDELWLAILELWRLMQAFSEEG